MEITIKPTMDQSACEIKSHAVTITHPEDDLTLYEVVDLINAALIAYGFSCANISQETKE